jgi:hypothetical protein
VRIWAAQDAAVAQVALAAGGWSDIRSLIRGVIDPLEEERDDLRGRLREIEAERERMGRRCVRLQRRCDYLQGQVDELKAKLEEEQRAARRQAAPFARRKRKQHPKKPGRKPGHEAANRSAPDEVDADVFVPLDTCPLCGGPVEDKEGLKPQTVIDVPPEVKPKVTRYHNESGYCPRCNGRVRSRHPDQASTATGAAGIQIGPRALALGVDLHYRVGVTFGKAAGIFEVFFGLRLCRATLARAAQRLAQRGEPTYRALIEVAGVAPVVNADETGWYITDAKRHAWLHVFALPEPKITIYCVRLSRGGDVAAEILGADFGGTIGTDGWAGYDGFKRRGQCNGHLLRRAAELLEVQKRGAARFPLGVQRVLLEGMAVKAMRLDLPPGDYAACADQIRGEMAALLDGRIEEIANRRFAKHLRRYQDQIFTYLDVPLLGATNNLAEQEIRPAVVVRKISAGNRTDAGAHAHEVLTTLARTAERNGLFLPDLLPDLLRLASPTYILPVVPALAARPTAPTQEKIHGPDGSPARPGTDGGGDERQVRPARRRVLHGNAAAPRPPPA